MYLGVRMMDVLLDGECVSGLDMCPLNDCECFKWHLHVSRSNLKFDAFSRSKCMARFGKFMSVFTGLAVIDLVQLRTLKIM